MKNFFRSFALTVSIIACIILAIQDVSAEKLGIAVDEGKIAFDVDAEEEQTFVVKVTNVSDTDQRVYVGAMDYEIGDDNRITLLEGADESNGVKDWLTPSETDFVLPPDMGKDVVFTVRVPQTASVGSHRGAAIFRALPSDDADVKVQGQIGVHVLINVKGDTRADGTLHGFDVPLFVIDEVRYAAEFENTGNIHYVPYGEVNVHNILTSRQENYDLNAADHFVFPGKRFTFEQTHEIPSIFGIYRAQARFVDGNGRVHVKSDLMMGYLFPLCFVIGIVSGWWIIRWIKRYANAKNIKNDRNNATHEKTE